MGQDQRPRHSRQRGVHGDPLSGAPTPSERPTPSEWRRRSPPSSNRDQFDRVSSLMRSRAPKIVHPRRVGSPFLLTGLVKCNTCRRAFTGQYSKEPQVPLLRLSNADEAGQRRLRRPEAQRPALRGDGSRDGSHQRPHRELPARPDEAGGRGGG